MKKYIVLAAFVILAVSSIGYLYINYKVEAQNILNNNKEYVELYNKEIEGNEQATLINKIENKNENNLVARDENGLFIENDTNSIIINIKFKQSDSIFRGEKISRNGITNFVNLYSAAKFKCTNVEYHKNSKYIKSIFFEEI